ncbi:hypothetical protein IAT40_002810 [Kwoniella sp. CBS 6097]
MSVSGPSRVGGTYTSSGRQSLPPLATLQSLGNYNGMGTPRTSGVPTRSSLGSAGLPGGGGKMNSPLPTSKSMGSLASYANNHNRDHRGSSESAHGNGNGNGSGNGAEKAKKKKNKKGMKGWAWVVEDENGNIIDAPDEESDEDAKAKAKAKAKAQAEAEAEAQAQAQAQGQTKDKNPERASDPVGAVNSEGDAMDIDGITHEGGRRERSEKSMGSDRPISRASISSAPLPSVNDYHDEELSSPPPVFSRASSALTDLIPANANANTNTKRTRRTSSPATGTGTNTAAGTPRAEVNDRKLDLVYLPGNSYNQFRHLPTFRHFAYIRLRAA